MNGNGSYSRSPKNHKPKWVAWGMCKRCTKKFDTRNRTRVYCPGCAKKVGKLVEEIYKFNVDILKED